MMWDQGSPKAGGGQGKGEAAGGLKFAVYARKLGDHSNIGWKFVRTFLPFKKDNIQTQRAESKQSID